MDPTAKSHISNTRFLGVLVALSIIVCLVAVSSAIGADAQRAKRVLIISTGSRFAPGFALVEQSAVDRLRQVKPGLIEFYSEHLDIIRFSKESYQRLFRDYLNEKYAEYPPDILVLFYVGNFAKPSAWIRRRHEV